MAPSKDVHLLRSHWAQRQDSKTASCDLGVASVGHQVAWTANLLRFLLQVKSKMLKLKYLHFLFRVQFDANLFGPLVRVLLYQIFPIIRLGRPPLSLGISTHRCVTALRSDFTFAHFQILTNTQHHLYVVQRVLLGHNFVVSLRFKKFDVCF